MSFASETHSSNSPTFIFVDPQTPENFDQQRADREDLSGSLRRRRILPLTPSTVHITPRAPGDNDKNGHCGVHEEVRQSQQENTPDPFIFSSPASSYESSASSATDPVIGRRSPVRMCIIHYHFVSAQFSMIQACYTTTSSTYSPFFQCSAVKTLFPNPVADGALLRLPVSRFYCSRGIFYR